MAETHYDVTMLEALVPVSVAGMPLQRYFHICAFFDSRDEEYAVLGGYYCGGLEANEKALHIVAPELRAEHRQRLVGLGIDVERCEHTGQLQIVAPFFTPPEQFLNELRRRRARVAEA